MRKRSKRILSLDIATNTGWAVAEVDGECTVIDLHYGSLCFEAESYGLRYIKCRDCVVDLLRKWKPDHVVFEMVDKPRGAKWAQLYNGFLSQVLIACEETKTPYIGYSITQWKKMLTGKGTASKEDVAVIVEKTTGEVLDRTSEHWDDQSDAIGILLVFLADPHTKC